MAAIHYIEKGQGYTTCGRKDTGKPNIYTTNDKKKITCKQCKRKMSDKTTNNTKSTGKKHNYDFIMKCDNCNTRMFINTQSNTSAMFECPKCGSMTRIKK